MGNGVGRWMNWMKVWTEHRPAPLDLSDTEILDWLSEYCDRAIYNNPTSQSCGGFTLYRDEIRSNASTLREAVCLAAAKWREVND